MVRGVVDGARPCVRVATTPLRKRSPNGSGASASTASMVCATDPRDRSPRRAPPLPLVLPSRVLPPGYTGKETARKLSGRLVSLIDEFHTAAKSRCGRPCRFWAPFGEHRHSKAPAVSRSVARRAEAVLEGFIAPFPARDIAFEEREVCFHIARFDSSAPRFMRSRTLAVGTVSRSQRQ